MRAYMSSAAFSFLWWLISWWAPLTPSTQEKFLGLTPLPKMKVGTRGESVQKARTMRSSMRRTWSVWSPVLRTFLASFWRWGSAQVAMRLSRASISASAVAGSLFSSARALVLKAMRFSTARTESKYSSSFMRSVLPTWLRRDLASSATRSRMLRSSSGLPAWPVERKRRSKARRGLISLASGGGGVVQATGGGGGGGERAV